ncbi:MAG: DUF1573 domain-containing protein [Chitinophagaceae bacterium]
MKRSILFFTAIALFTVNVNAQSKSKKSKKSKTVSEAPAPVKAAPAPVAPATPPTPRQNPVTHAPAAPASPAQNPDKSMKFTNEDHNFGTIPEGPAVSFDFEFKNISSEPVVLSSVNASCGCTTPTWTKDPVLPGKTGKITATYNTQGRPGSFTKTITVNSNAGTKVLKISGLVEKAPDASVPANNNSMIKH